MDKTIRLHDSFHASECLIDGTSNNFTFNKKLHYVFWFQHLVLRCHCAGLFHEHGKTPRLSVKPPLELHRELNCRASYRIMSNHTGILKAPKNLGLCRTYQIQYKLFFSASINIQRDPLFSTISADDVLYFKEILGDKSVIQDEDRLLAANVDWMGKYKGSSQLLLLPKTTEEVLILYITRI